MKIKFLPSCLLIFLFFIATDHIYSAASLDSFDKTDASKKYDLLWNKVDSLDLAGLRRSAGEASLEIYNLARAEHNPVQLLKAVIHRLKYQDITEEDALLKNIKVLETETKEAGLPEKMILHSMLGEIYNRYYQNNRYRFLHRSPSDDINNEDPATWDLKKIVQTCIEHYDASLSHSELTKNIAVNVFDEILIPGEPADARNFRPGLYDFLAHRALDYYMNSENGLTKVAESFSMNDAAFLGSATEFLNFQLPSIDTSNLKYKACLVFKELLRFHEADKNPGAFLDADLGRLAFVYQTINLKDKDSLYENSLRKLALKYSQHPLSSEIYYQIALLYEQKGNSFNEEENPKDQYAFVNAMMLCDTAIKMHPDSRAAKECRNMLSRIKQGSISFQIEQVNSMGKAFRARLEYKNVQKIWLRIIQDDNSLSEQRNRYGEEYIKDLLNSNVMQSWSVELDPDSDLRVHSTEIALPSLDYGRYMLLISDEENFSTETGFIGYGSFRISDLSLLSRRNTNGEYEFFIRDRNSGEPLDGVEVEVSNREYDQSGGQFLYRLAENLRSDKDGRILVRQTAERQRNFNLKLKKGRDVNYLDESFYQYTFRSGRSQATERTVFFTDRSIYRPGQLIYFKAILLSVEDGISAILPDKPTVVQLFDVNGKLQSELKLRSNEYGTVEGFFTAPQGVLNGNMRIQNTSGSVSFSVEEYKRPRFEVKFNEAEGTYKLGQIITLTGNAKTYSGVPVDASNVTYRVTRLASFPPWCYWYRGIFPQQLSMEILSGETSTDDQGNFEIRFVALPDESIPEKYDPVFNFQVTADVTDINGETRSSTGSLRAGYKAIELSTTVPVEMNLELKKTYSVQAKNLSGKSVAAIVKLDIFRLKEPDRLMRERKWSACDKFIYSEDEYRKIFPFDIYKNEDEFKNWQKEAKLYSVTLNTESDSILSLDSENWQQGVYMMEGLATDSFGKEIRLLQYFTAFRPSSKGTPGNPFFKSRILEDHALPGMTDRILVSSAAKNVHLLVELELKNKIISRQWIKLSAEQKILDFPVKEEYRGNFSVHLSVVKEGRSYVENIRMNVPWTNKNLIVEYETFRSALNPGKKEEWKLRIKNPDGKDVNAELLLSMYDASLDAFRAHEWKTGFYSSYSTTLPLYPYMFSLSSANMFHKRGLDFENVDPIRYDELNWFGYEYAGYPMLMNGRSALSMAADGTYYEAEGVKRSDAPMMKGDTGTPPVQETANEEQQEVKEPEISIRKNLQETAFFFPKVYTGKDSTYEISFTSPEALTKWKLQLFAHTKDLKYVFDEKELITQKELMLVPNLPRFLRAGDTITLSAKINSLLDSLQSGKARLHIADILSGENIDSLFSNNSGEQIFYVSKTKSAVAEWKIIVPENVSLVSIVISAHSGNYTDGEEQSVPVLSNRQFVTEALPIWLRGSGSRKFEFKKLSQNSSSTLVNHALKLEYTTNPVWTVVQALPYLMDYPYECSEQIFSRYFANGVASYIAQSNPKIQAVFNSWKKMSPETFLSNLEKNQELKSVVLEQTPWVLEATGEKEQREQIAMLFETNHIMEGRQTALARLLKAQNSNGYWSWFEGMPDDRYITQHITCGLLKMQHLGITSQEENDEIDFMVRRATVYLDGKIKDDYDRLIAVKADLDNYIPGALQLQYLYLRSFDQSRRQENQSKREHDYFLKQAYRSWLKYNEYLQSMLALSLNRNGDSKMALVILNSLKDNALHSDEMGMYWKNITEGYSWQEAGVESQAMIIEAFDEILKDEQSVGDMKIWMLRQKQTKHWKSTKATVEACYALLLRGQSLIQEENSVRIKLGDKGIASDEAGMEKEAGTGYFSMSWRGDEIKNNMGKVEITDLTAGKDSLKKSSVISWGALYWQYTEDLNKITESGTAALNLRKNLFVQRAGHDGPVLEKIVSGTRVHVGDRIVVRVEMRADRDMEYVHMKDLRASGLEPENVLSTYKWQDGLGYYESTRDASTDFFISYLPKGTYVFEYTLRAAHQGYYSSGITTIQNMYAPDFSAQSFGENLQILGE